MDNQIGAIDNYQKIMDSFSKDELGLTIYPSEYGGAYIEDCCLIVQLTESNEATQSKYLQICDSEYIRFKEVKYSINDLLEYKEYADELENNGYDVIGYGICEKDNSFNITINENSNIESIPSTYEQGIPLHKMDFDIYKKYFPSATASAFFDFDTDSVILQKDLNYYLYKDDDVPILTLEKGTEIYVVCMDGSGFSIDRHSYLASIYGLQSWPDYDAEWRYASPFFTKEFSYDDRTEDDPMYYVKTDDLESVARLFYDQNPSLENAYGSFDEFEYKILGYVDQILYDSGAFCS